MRPKSSEVLELARKFWTAARDEESGYSTSQVTQFDLAARWLREYGFMLMEREREAGHDSNNDSQATGG